MNAERDRLLEQALRRQLSDAGSAPVSDACLDAETVAAWLDGGLDAPAVALAQAHASTCARCQAVVGTLVQTLPAEAAVAPRGIRLWRWWLAPLAATAAAATMWMVVPQEPVARPESAAFNETAAAESLAVPAAPAPAAAEPQAAPAEVRGLAKERADAISRDRAELKAEARTTEAPKVLDSEAAGRLEAAAPPALRSQAGAPVDERITAQSSPSPDVVWRVGRAGLVQLAIDGRTFVTLAFPEAVDLAGVTATDERRATVTTVDGRTFVTDDGGRTWTRP